MTQSKLYNNLIENGALGDVLTPQELCSLTGQLICPIKAILILNDFYSCNWRASIYPIEDGDTTYLCATKALPIRCEDMYDVDNIRSLDIYMVGINDIISLQSTNYSYDRNTSMLSIQLPAPNESLDNVDTSIIILITPEHRM